MDAVKETIRKLYATLENDLDVKDMIGKLQSSKLIGTYQKEEILSKSNRVDRNRVLLDHLQLFDVSHLRCFCDVLSTSCPPLGSRQAQLISDTLDGELSTIFWCIRCTLSFTSKLLIIHNRTFEACYDHLFAAASVTSLHNITCESLGYWYPIWYTHTSIVLCVFNTLILCIQMSCKGISHNA